MASIAKLSIIGNLGQDPTTAYSRNGRMNVQFSVAVSKRRTDANGNVEEIVNWIRCTCWGQLAETLDRLVQQGYLTKGRQVYVSGTFEAREYKTDQGETRTSLDVTADTVLMTGTNPHAGTEPTF